MTFATLPAGDHTPPGAPAGAVSPEAAPAFRAVRPLAIDLFCGLGGWTEGLMAEGYDVVGYDIEEHEYDGELYPARLVLEDVLALHGSRFADAALIVASPPCQEYSYMAMPWTRAKAKAAAIRADATGAELERLNALFDACFRIQRQACAAAGRHIPLVVENVRGAIPWVGRSRWNYGSFHLWGDVPALMPAVTRATKVPGFRFDGRTTCFQQAAVEGMKNQGGSWFNVGAPGQKVVGQNPDRQLKPPARVSEQSASEGRKSVGSGAQWFDQNIASLPSGSNRRKAASARIAKIPPALSRWIASAYFPAQAIREVSDRPHAVEVAPMRAQNNG